MKLPIIKAIATTSAFALQHWLDLLRIIWAPIVIYLASFTLLQPILQRFAVRMAYGIEPVTFFTEMPPWYLLYLAISTAFGLVTSTGILKFVLRGEKPRLPFYLGFGMDEVRLLITSLVFVCIFFLLQVSIIVLASINTALTNLSYPLGVISTFVLVVAVVWFLVRLILRLSLTMAASIDTRRVGVKPGVAGTSGNEMHLLGYWLLWALIGAIFSAATTALLVPEMIGVYLKSFDPPSFNKLLAIEEATAASIRNFDISTPMGAVRTVANWVLLTIQTVIGLLAAGVAWRMISEGRQTAAPAAPDAAAVTAP